MIGSLTDVHQHLLWGVDDGAQTPEAMQHMLQEAQAQGIGCICATAHAAPGFTPFDMGLYRERLSEAQAYCAANGLTVRVLPGAEVAWTFQTVEALRRRSVPTLGETDFVLLELWRDISLHEAKNAVTQLTRAGFCPVIAHAERYRCFAWSPHQALRFRAETGAQLQVNADTVMHPRGMLQQRFVRILLKEQGIDAIATDAHGRPERPVNLRPVHDWLLSQVDAAYARSLTTFAGEFE